MHRFSKMQLLRAAAFLPAALWLSAASRPESVVSPRVMDSHGKLPLSFEANRGQTEHQVKFLSRGRGYTLFLTESATAVLSLHGKEASAVLRMKLGGANAHARVSGADPLPGKSNYFIGNDPSQWRTDISTYGAVKYTAVYPGIDLVYHGNQQLLEYDFVVAPGADPRAIDIRFQGAQKLSVNGDGALVIGLGGEEVIEHPPVVYQEVGGERTTVAGRYVLRGKGRVGFEVADYDRGQELVIDPVLVYSTYLGGSTDSIANAIAVDAAGNAYITGSTSWGFPTTHGAIQPVHHDTGQNAFVTKLNASGTALVYSTYLGWSVNDGGNGIAVDASGNAYVTGFAGPNFPTTQGAFQSTFSCGPGCPYIPFVAKLNATGSALVYSTYLVGSTYGWGSAIAVDASGHAYVTGNAGPGLATTQGAFQTTTWAQTDPYTGFVAKLNLTGSSLVYSTYLSGSSISYCNGIAVDVSGNAFVTGTTYRTSSGAFPTTPGALQTTLGGNLFVTKLNAAGSAPVYSTYLGPVVSDYGNDAKGIAVDASGNAYIVGNTSSPKFPVTPGAFQATLGGGGKDGFVSKLNATGSALIYSTYLGGSAPESIYSIAVDTVGNASVAGWTWSTDFPITPDALQTTYGGGYSNGFVTTLNDSGSALLYSTYLGTGHFDHGGVAVDAARDAYVTGSTTSSDFPTTPGAYQTKIGGGYDVFVSKLSLGTIIAPSPRTTANLSGPSGKNGWYLGAVTVTLLATAGNSPISATYYNIDGGPYLSYSGPFSISTAGVHQLFYYSVNAAGRQEAPRGQALKIDASTPVSKVAVLPAVAASPNFNVQWSGTDATSGLASYTIYVSEDGKPFARWLSNVATTQAWYRGVLLHTYAFYSIATDIAGNVENKTAAEATTQVPQMPGDVTGEGMIDCYDLTYVRALLGKSAGQMGFDPKADVNNDGVVNVLDLAIVAQKLPPGTKCP